MRARDNPFRTERVLTVRYRFIDGADWPALLRRLASLEYRAALVGAEGSGKTTLQEELAARLQARGRTIRWLRLNRENRHNAVDQIESLFTTAAESDLLFVDGAEQLGPLRWRRFAGRASRCGGLVITTHAPGRLPTLIDCHTTSALLHEIVGELTPANARPSADLLDALFAQHEGNLRLCLRTLYDRWAAQPMLTTRSGTSTRNGQVAG